jgi:hypothetical protein
LDLDGRKKVRKRGVLVVFASTGSHSHTPLSSPQDIIEDQVTNIWIPTSGSYHNDVTYAASLGEDDLSTSSFAAMSISRDGGNLFTESRLNEIKARMEKTEKTTVCRSGSVLVSISCFGFYMITHASLLSISYII